MLENSKQEAIMARTTTSRAIGTVGVWQTFGKISLPSSHGYHLLFEQEPDIQEHLQIVDQLKLKNCASRQSEMGKSPDLVNLQIYRHLVLCQCENQSDMWQVQFTVLLLNLIHWNLLRLMIYTWVKHKVQWHSEEGCWTLPPCNYVDSKLIPCLTSPCGSASLSPTSCKDWAKACPIPSKLPQPAGTGKNPWPYYMVGPRQICPTGYHQCISDTASCLEEWFHLVATCRY